MGQHKTIWQQKQQGNQVLWCCSKHHQIRPSASPAHQIPLNTPKLRIYTDFKRIYGGPIASLQFQYSGCLAWLDAFSAGAEGRGGVFRTTGGSTLPQNEAARGKLSLLHVRSVRPADRSRGRQIDLVARRARAATVRTSSRTLFLSCLPHRKHGISTRTRSTRSTRSSSTGSSTEAATKSTRSSSTGSRSTSTQRRNDRRSNRGSTDKQQGAHFLRDFCAQVGHLCCCVSGYMLFTCCWFLSSISLC